MSSYGALKILAETGNGQQKRDMLSISTAARQFSKESMVALVDQYACATTTTVENFKFYFAHYNDMRAILDAINFSEAPSFCTAGFKEFGTMEFEWNGTRQIVPVYAVPRINAKNLPRLQARGNVLRLNNKSYYSLISKSGKSYAMYVNNGYVDRPFTEVLFGEGCERIDQEEVCKLKSILTDLAKGHRCAGKVKDILHRVGIMEGHFTVEAGAGTHHYILRENGTVDSVDYWIKFLNEMDWIEAGYQEDDIFKVYGNEYKIGSDGHIHVSIEEGFTDTKIVYPFKSK